MSISGFLFKVRVLSKNVKENTLARYFIKVTARPSFRTTNSD